MGINARMFGYTLHAAFTNKIFWGTNNSVNKVKIALMKSSWTPSQTSNEKWADISANEITGTNYTQQALTFPNPYYAATQLPDPGGIMSLKANSVTFSNITTDQDIHYAAIYQWVDGGSGYSLPLLGWIKFASPISCTGEDLVLNWTDNIVMTIALDTADPAPPLGRMFVTAALKAFDGQVSWYGGNVKAALMKTGWAPNQDTNDYWNDISSSELAATGNYAKKTLTGTTAAYIPPESGYGGHVDFYADDIQWANLTSSENFQWIAIFQDTGDASTSPLLGYIKLADSTAAVNQNFSVEWGSGVVLQIYLDDAADV